MKKEYFAPYVDIIRMETGECIMELGSGNLQGAQMVTTWVAVQMKKPLKLSLHGAFGTSIVIMNDNEKTKKRYE